MSIEIVVTTTLTGVPITTANFKRRQALTGTWPNKVLPDTPTSGTEEIFLRGQSLRRSDSTDGYTISGANVTMGSNVEEPGASDELYADYLKS